MFWCHGIHHEGTDRVQKSAPRCLLDRGGQNLLANRPYTHFAFQKGASTREKLNVWGVMVVNIGWSLILFTLNDTNNRFSNQIRMTNFVIFSLFKMTPLSLYKIWRVNNQTGSPSLGLSDPWSFHTHPLRSTWVLVRRSKRSRHKSFQRFFITTTHVRLQKARRALESSHCKLEEASKMETRQIDEYRTVGI